MGWLCVPFPAHIPFGAPVSTSPGYALVAPSRERRGVLLRLKPDQELAADHEHRTFDHRRLRDHQGDRLFLGERVLVLLGQRAERGAGAVEQRLPADLAGPAFEACTLDARRLVVVEHIRDACWSS